MVGFARDEIEERSRLGFCDMPLSPPLHTVLFLLVFIQLSGN
jgi:hypothetical protein